MNNVQLNLPNNVYSATYGSLNGERNRDLTLIPKFDPNTHNRNHGTALPANEACPIDFEPLAGRATIYHGGPGGFMHPLGLNPFITSMNFRIDQNLQPECPVCRQGLDLAPLGQPPREIVHRNTFSPLKAVLALGVIAASGTIYYRHATTPNVPQFAPPKPFVPPKQYTPKPIVPPKQYTPEQLRGMRLIHIPDTPPKGYCEEITQKPKRKIEKNDLKNLVASKDAKAIESGYSKLTSERINALRDKCTEKEIERFLNSFKNRTSLEFKLIDAASRGRLDAVAVHAKRLSRKIRNEEIPNARFQKAIHAAAKFGEINIINYLVDKYQISQEILNCCLYNAAFDDEELAFLTLQDAGAICYSNEYTSNYAFKLGLEKNTPVGIWGCIMKRLGR